MFNWTKRAAPQKQFLVESYERFVREFVAECQRQDRLPKRYEHQARAFVFADGAREMRFQLDNIFATWLKHDRNGRAEVISRFVRAVDEPNNTSAISPERLPDELTPGVRSRVQISNTLIQSWIDGAPIDDSAGTAWLPFVGDLAACVMRNKRHTMSQMTRANLAFANLPIDRAIRQAVTNFRTSLPSPIFEPIDQGVFGCRNLEDHQSALLLLEPGADYRLPPIEGAPVALVPSRNLLLLTGSEDVRGLARLLEIAQGAHQMSNFCSATMLHWTGHRWSEFHFRPGSAGARREREISLVQSASDYGLQKQLLDQFHQKHGRDIFVANLMFYRGNDVEAPVFSVTALASGTTGTLLPRADRLSFVRQIVDPDTGLAQKDASDIANVAWSDAMDIAGDLFEPVPFLYPPRLRALSFPDAHVWARLKRLNPSPHP
jgi:hypothetical protein